MAFLTKIQRFSSESWENRESEEDENHTDTVFDVFQGKMTEVSRICTDSLLLKMNTEKEKEKTVTGGNEDIILNTLYQQHIAQKKAKENIVLQKLIVASRLPSQDADRTAVGEHFEKLHFQLSKEFELDHMTGLLLIYPLCVLHIVESSREILLRVLEDLKNIQQQPDCAMLEESKLVFLIHNPHSRLFQQWSYKVIDAGQMVQALDEEENTESLVCTVLSALQELEKSRHIPESWEFIISQELVLKLLGQVELLSPEEHLQMFNSPLNISMDFDGLLTEDRTN